MANRFSVFDEHAWNCGDESETELLTGLGVFPAEIAHKGNPIDRNRIPKAANLKAKFFSEAKFANI